MNQCPPIPYSIPFKSTNPSMTPTSTPTSSPSSSPPKQESPLQNGPNLQITPVEYSVNDKLKMLALKNKLCKLFHTHFTSGQLNIYSNTLLMQYCLTLLEKFKKEDDIAVIIYIKNAAEIYVSTVSYSCKGIEEVLIICNNLKLLEHFLYFFNGF